MVMINHWYLTQNYHTQLNDKLSTCISSTMVLNSEHSIRGRNCGNTLSPLESRIEDLNNAYWDGIKKSVFWFLYLTFQKSNIIKVSILLQNTLIRRKSHFCTDVLYLLYYALSVFLMIMSSEGEQFVLLDRPRGKKGRCSGTVLKKWREMEEFEKGCRVHFNVDLGPSSWSWWNWNLRSLCFVPHSAVS